MVVFQVEASREVVIYRFLEVSGSGFGWWFGCQVVLASGYNE